MSDTVTILKKDLDHLLKRQQELCNIVAEFAYYFSSDEDRHWELLKLASGSAWADEDE